VGGNTDTSLINEAVLIHVACSTIGDIRNEYKIFIGKLKVRERGKSRREWKDNVRMYLPEMGLGRDVDWMHLALRTGASGGLLCIW
jgi:hypothetical protein